MTKEFYDAVYKEGHPSGYDGGEEGMPHRTQNLYKATTAWLQSTGLFEISDAKILEIGCGMAYLSKIHSGWHGAEYSETAVRRVKEREGIQTKIFVEDAQSLSFDDDTFDGVFSWAALEHVPNPEKAFSEIDRVLKRGGRINCSSLEL